MSSFYIYTRAKIFIFLKIMLFVGCSTEMPKWTNLTKLIKPCCLKNAFQRLSKPRYVFSCFQSESQWQQNSNFSGFLFL